MTNPSPPEPQPRQPLPLPLEPMTSELSLRPSSGLPWLIVLVLLGGGAWMFMSGRVPLGPTPDGEPKIRELQEVAQKNAAFSDTEEHRLVQASWQELLLHVKSAQKQLDGLIPTVGEFSQLCRELE